MIYKSPCALVILVVVLLSMFPAYGFWVCALCLDPRGGHFQLGLKNLPTNSPPRVEEWCSDSSYSADGHHLFFHTVHLFTVSVPPLPQDLALLIPMCSTLFFTKVAHECSGHSILTTSPSEHYLPSTTFHQQIVLVRATGGSCV